MADTKLADLTSGAPAAASDILYVVRDPSGTPLDRKLTIANVKDYILGLANTWTGKQTISGASFTLSGNISAPAWTTSGIRYANVAATLTDTSSSGTVAVAYTDLFGGNTIAASNATTFTDYFTMYVSAATAGTNVTFTNKWALGLAGNLKLGPDASGTNQVGTNVIIGGSQGTGTGAGGSIIFQVAPAGGTGAAQNALATALTIDSTRLVTAFNLGINNGSATLSTSGMYLTSNFTASFPTISALNSTNNASLRAYGVIAASNKNIAFSATTDSQNGTPDVILARDAANTLALRNGTSGQAFNVYNTYTNGTSYERYSVDWITTANLVIVGPNKGSGGGTQRVQRLAYLEDGGSGSTTPSLGTTCPAASATIKSWIKVITSDGSTGYIPCWA